MTYVSSVHKDADDSAAFVENVRALKAVVPSAPDPDLGLASFADRKERSAAGAADTSVNFVASRGFSMTPRSEAVNGGTLTTAGLTAAERADQISSRAIQEISPEISDLPAGDRALIEAKIKDFAFNTSGDLSTSFERKGSAASDDPALERKEGVAVKEGEKRALDEKSADPSKEALGDRDSDRTAERTAEKNARRDAERGSERDQRAETSLSEELKGENRQKALLALLSNRHLREFRLASEDRLTSEEPAADRNRDHARALVASDRVVHSDVVLEWVGTTRQDLQRSVALSASHTTRAAELSVAGTRREDTASTRSVLTEAFTPTGSTPNGLPDDRRSELKARLETVSLVRGGQTDGNRPDIDDFKPTEAVSSSALLEQNLASLEAKRAALQDGRFAAVEPARR